MLVKERRAMTLFRNMAVSLMMVLIAQSAWARESFGLVSVGYGNPANISADLDLEEINPDQYPEYDLDPGRVWMARKAYSTVSLEVGVVFYKKVSLGLNGTLQIAGYPSETVASAFIPAATLSIWY
jgi:hypothetical protein